MHTQDYTATYPQKKSYNRYDDEHFLLYLNEEIIKDYLPQDADEDTQPITAYRYTGTFPDGGTLIKANESTYENFVSGLIRTKYSADQVEAIILNFQSNHPERMPEFIQDMEDLNIFREECKYIIHNLLED